MKYIPLLLSPLLASCMQTVWVYEDSPDGEAKQITGLPFYVKVEREIKTVIYERKWTEVKFSVTKFETIASEDGEIEKEENKASYIKQINNTDRSDYDDFKSDLFKYSRTPLTNEALVTRMIDKFRRMRATDPESLPLELISSVNGSEWIVDNKKHYLNAPLPWFGTSELTYDLNGDGTLAKATSKPDNSNLATAITSFIPFKEYFDAKWVQPKLAKITAEGSDADKNRQDNQFSIDEKAFSYKFTLSMEEKGEQYKCKVIKETDTEIIMPTTEDGMKTQCDEYSFTVLPIPTEQKSVNPKPKSDEPPKSDTGKESSKS